MDTALNQLPDSISDGTILLDAYRLEDAEAHLSGEDEEMRRRFDAVRPASLDETRRAIKRWIAGRARGGPMFAYAVRDVSGRLMGGCELRMRSADSANVSYWLFPQFRGRGHALQALNLVCEASERIAGLNRLELRISPDNESSRRVAERGGFLQTGTIEEKGGTGAVSMMIAYVKDVSGTENG
jgi:RimJ/RimL family protein N-acetyltransferase